MDATTWGSGEDHQREVRWLQGDNKANVYQKTVDYADELANGYHIMLDSRELVTVRWEPVKSAAPSQSALFRHFQKAPSRKVDLPLVVLPEHG